jgi:dihydroorotate dehydrogenase
MLALAGSFPIFRQALKAAFSISKPGFGVKVFGLEFPNCIGLAAGYDKDGLGMSGLACLGFGHLELGTVTPNSQVGNPKPRLFRLPEDHALINRMGFPNNGAEALVERLKKNFPKGVVVGVNIGKGLSTPIEEAAGDYLSLMRSFYTLADYLAINVSSPNTIGLRRLQARDHLKKLLTSVLDERRSLSTSTGRQVPVLIKLAPDLEDDELEDAMGVIQMTGMDGVIATNTTISREGLGSRNQAQTGGLSGKPLFEKAVAIVSKIHRLTSGKLPIIGVGGIASPDEAKAMLDAGASLIQLYTGLVYQGPGVVRKILEGIDRSEV